ncbi:hypothetical protein LZ023_39140 (plasmid) [Pseudomonas silvicola]|nr:hypothetical protein LZ023_39140 [Pseudomonas silvicola]
MKDHSGTHLCGDDLNIRMALKEIITNSVFSHYQMVDSRIDRFSRTKLVDQFGKVNVENCTSLIGFIESELSIAISEPYYTNLFSHLLVTIQRVSGLAEQPTITSFHRHSCKEWMIAEKRVMAGTRVQFTPAEIRSQLYLSIYYFIRPSCIKG